MADIGPLPEAGKGDVARDVVVSAASLVPVVGSVAELLDRICRPSFERRRDAWLRTLGEAVEEIAERMDGFDPDRLSENEQFISGVVEASKIAYGEHLDAKLEMLKACLVHMAPPDALPDFLAMRFLRFVDELEPEHFIVLRYASDPPGWYDTHHVTRPTFTHSWPKEIMEQAQVHVTGIELEVVLRDLQERRLVNATHFGAGGTDETAWSKWTSPLGDELLAFITLI